MSEDFSTPSPTRPTTKPRPVSEAVLGTSSFPVNSTPPESGSAQTRDSPDRKQTVFFAPATPQARVPSELIVSEKLSDSNNTPQPQISIQSNISTRASITSHTPLRTGQITAQRTDMTSPRTSSYGNLNGQNGTNGVLSPPMSPKAMFRSKGRLPSFTSSRAPSNNFSTTMRTFTKRANGGNSHKIGLVQESAAALKKRSMAELGAGVYQSVSNVSYVNFLEWIRSERLTTLPHKGSRWDKVLIRKSNELLSKQWILIVLRCFVLCRAASQLRTSNSKLCVGQQRCSRNWLWPCAASS